MRIAMLAPITHRLPPEGYGPWEQVTSDLTDGLVALGHHVTLFGPEGSKTAAELAATVPAPLEEWPADLDEPDPRVWEELHIARAMESVAAGDFDLIHSHLHVHALAFGGLLTLPILSTLHGVAWNRSVHPALAAYRHHPFVSISDAERQFFPTLNYVATVYNGIDVDAFPPGRGGGGFVLFAGRVAEEKAPHLALHAARSQGYPLRLVGPVEPKHRRYFETQVQPLLDGRDYRYVGPLKREELGDLYRAADALMMPLAWDEPFGLVVAESLASGTPVIGWRRGAVPELIRDGVTGAVVDDVEGAAAAIGRIDTFDRAACRDDALTRFSTGAMAQGYVAAYQRILDR